MNRFEARLKVAEIAARRAGALLLKHLGHLHKNDIQTKSRNNFVTQVDRRSEALVVSIIRKSFPQDAILGEESGASGSGSIQWIIDPLDGTSNYIHQIPFFCVSIAVTENEKPAAATIFDPLRGELYTALRGKGAFLNGKKIRVSTRSIGEATVGNAIPYRSLHARFPEYRRIVTGVSSAQCDIRRTGSAALDLALVSAGRLDGFWGFDQCPWDSAAGALLIQEAGGKLRALRGGAWSLHTPDFIAGNPTILSSLARITGASRRRRA